MTILTRDETEHDTEYVLATEVQQEIEAHQMQVLQLLRQARELRLALQDLLAEYEDRQSQYGTDYLWQKHEDKAAIVLARDTYTKTAHLITQTP
jgi:hypothetical protein